MFRSQLELDLVLTSRQLIKDVAAVLIGSRRGNFLTVTVEQGDLYTFKNFSVTLYAIIIRINPYVVTHGIGLWKFNNRIIEESDSVRRTVFVNDCNDFVFGKFVTFRRLYFLDDVGTGLLDLDCLDVSVGVVDT